MNMIQNAKDQVLDLTVSAYQKAAAEGLLPQDAAVTPSVEIPKDTANGDYTTTFCLAAAKALKKNPRQVAQILMDHMDLSGSYFTSVEMAGPGFLNFRLGNKWFRDTVACVEQEGAAYGCNDALKGQTITVAASPTPHAEILEVAKEILAAKGITLDIQVYNDYVVPNTVVDDGTLDANYFQHLPYLEDFNAENNTHIVSVSAIHVEPMGLYGGLQTSLDALKASK